MNVDVAIRRECARLAVGHLIADAVMCVVFAALSRLDYTVPLGAALGSAVAVLNFFLLGVTVQKAANEGGDQKRAVQASYTLRMLMVSLAVILGIVLPFIHPIAVTLPFLLNTPLIYILQILARNREKNAAKPEEVE